MASLKKHIETGLRMYPSLFQTAADVMEQAFCTGGNGLAWHKGELVNETHRAHGHADYDRLSVPNQKKAFLKSRKEDGMRAEAIRCYNELRKAGQLDAANRLKKIWDLPWRTEKDIQGRMQRMDLTHRKVYPMSDTKWASQVMGNSDEYPYVYFTEMLGVPDDVRPDWLKGIEMMCHIVRTQDLGKDRKKNLKIVELVEARVFEIKVQRGMLTKLEQQVYRHRKEIAQIK